MQARTQILLLSLLALLAGAGLANLGRLALPALWRAALGLVLLAVLLTILTWLAFKAAGALLWRVGRRLAISYLLIGVLPIPMVLTLFGLNLYLLAGYFLGHLYRDATHALEGDLRVAAESRLARFEDGARVFPWRDGEAEFAFYRDGRRVAGLESAPQALPAWLAPPAEPGAPDPGARLPVAFVELPDGTATLAAMAIRDDRAVLALYAGDIQQELSRRSDVRVQLLRADDPRKDSLIRVRLFGREYAFQPLGIRRALEDHASGRGGDEAAPPFWRRPVLWWGELSGPLRRLGDGSVALSEMAASLSASPETVLRHLISGSAEIDTAVWASLLALTGLLSTIYAVAVFMALYMIVSLSRAVNRLSRATDAVQRGDFATRIPVRRRDQVGELQRSFNEMTANLEQLVAATAEKESLEKELEIARRLQQSLLPADLPTSERVEFATLFEPSAAIGGDYFDILRLDDDRLAVVNADVAGHGLPTGLRMAMLKAALVILVQEAKPAQEILERLHTLVRAEQMPRFLVTASFSLVDFRQGDMEITNAGHPPTYLLRDGEVEEILLSGSPLGALGQSYSRRRISLLPGDVVVWLSDGLIEACDSAGEPFGYERIQAALTGPPAGAAEVRDRLLDAVRRHVDGHPAQDDRTLVAMRYFPAGSSPSRA